MPKHGYVSQGAFPVRKSDIPMGDITDKWPGSSVGCNPSVSD